jgi:galactofuranose transport system permease protein
MSGGRFSIFASFIGAIVIWTFTLTMYTFGVPANALLAGRALLVLIVILLYSDQTRRLLNNLSDSGQIQQAHEQNSDRKGPRHGTAN